MGFFYPGSLTCSILRILSAPLFGLGVHVELQRRACGHSVPVANPLGPVLRSWLNYLLADKNDIETQQRVSISVGSQLEQLSKLRS